MELIVDKPVFILSLDIIANINVDVHEKIVTFRKVAKVSKVIRLSH